jgi:hypothetical protein
MTLLLLIAFAWLAVAGFFATLCRMAARGDGAPGDAVVSIGSGDLTAAAGPLAWQQAPMLVARDLRSPPRTAAPTALRSTR